jgi:hypothetical protein
MKRYLVTFYDDGNCDLADATVSANSMVEALALATAICTEENPKDMADAVQAHIDTP